MTEQRDSITVTFYGYNDEDDDDTFRFIDKMLESIEEDVNPSIEMRVERSERDEPGTFFAIEGRASSIRQMVAVKRDESRPTEKQSLRAAE